MSVSSSTTLLQISLYFCWYTKFGCVNTYLGSLLFCWSTKIALSVREYECGRKNTHCFCWSTKILVVLFESFVFLLVYKNALSVHMSAAKSISLLIDELPAERIHIRLSQVSIVGQLIVGIQIRHGWLTINK